MDNLSLYLSYAFNFLILNERGIESSVRDSLLKALSEAQGILKNFYDKYSKDGKLSVTELSVGNRYANIERKLLDTITPVVENNIREMKSFLITQYEDSFLRGLHATEKILGKHYDIKIPSIREIQQKFSIKNVQNIYMKEAFNNYPINAQREIRKALMNGLFTGKSYESMANDLSHALRVIYSKALLIIRTESTAALNMGLDDAFNELLAKGVPGHLQWKSKIDEKTRPSNKYQIADHRVMDGQVKGEDGYYHLDSTGEKAPYPAWPGLSPEQRCNCRCHEELVIDGKVVAEDNGISSLSFEKWKSRFYPGEWS